MVKLEIQDQGSGNRGYKAVEVINNEYNSKEMTDKTDKDI
jgi:hypothetical protein